MISDRQRIEAVPTPSVYNNMPPTPSYQEVDGEFAPETQNGSTNSVGYFLGEVTKPLLICMHWVKSADAIIGRKLGLTHCNTDACPFSSYIMFLAFDGSQAIAGLKMNAKAKLAGRHMTT
ncbi:hypothetical protein Nepgr_025437 [Nepenthes gracilis]|uniref:Uncharacterized protein n=1 Tax=Nepenthes gracilis TaxID=150966 RepID=A0AAD3Y120_NEPGR|nr:hypothetical protein Nepgr_025437 [Nepenthes gracilis]